MLSAGQTTFSPAAVLPPACGSLDLSAGAPFGGIDGFLAVPADDDGAATTIGRRSRDDDVIIIPWDSGPSGSTTTWQLSRLFARPTGTSGNGNGAPAVPPASPGNPPSSPGRGRPGGESGVHATPIAKALELVDKLDGPNPKALALLEIAAVTGDERFVDRAEEVARGITNPRIGIRVSIRILSKRISLGPDAADVDKNLQAALMRTVEHLISAATDDVESAMAIEALTTALISRGWTPPLEARLALVPLEVGRMFRPMAFRGEESFEIRLRRATLYASDLISRGEFVSARALFRPVEMWTAVDLPKTLRRLRRDASLIYAVQDYAFGKIAEEMASAGLFEQAVRLAVEKVTPVTHQNQVLRRIVRAMAKAGHVDEAVEVAETIRDKFTRILAFVAIAEGSTGTKDGAGPAGFTEM